MMRQDVRDLLARYPATYREVAAGDCYGLARLKFAPQLAIDLGAHVGCFTASVLSRWPGCRVLAVEPDQESVTALRELAALLPGFSILQAALGRGRVRRYPWARSDGNTFWSDGCAEMCPEAEDWTSISEPVEIPCLTFQQIVATTTLPRDYIVKLDCEGAECTLYLDQEATEILQGARYIAAELHFKGMRWDNISCNDSPKVVEAQVGPMLDAAQRWLDRLAETHEVMVERTSRLWCLKALRRTDDESR